MSVAATRRVDQTVHLIKQLGDPGKDLSHASFFGNRRQQVGSRLRRIAAIVFIFFFVRWPGKETLRIRSESMVKLEKFREITVFERIIACRTLLGSRTDYRCDAK